MMAQQQATALQLLTLYGRVKILATDDPQQQGAVGCIGVLVDLFPDRGFGNVELSDEDEERVGFMVASIKLENLEPAE